MLEIKKILLRRCVARRTQRPRVEIPIGVMNGVLRPAHCIGHLRLAIAGHARTGAGSGVAGIDLVGRSGSEPFLLVRPDADANLSMSRYRPRLELQRLGPVHGKLMHADFDSVHSIVNVTPAGRYARRCGDHISPLRLSHTIERNLSTRE